jgi:hypothetical protein
MEATDIQIGSAISPGKLLGMIDHIAPLNDTFYANLGQVALSIICKRVLG